MKITATNILRRIFIVSPFLSIFKKVCLHDRRAAKTRVMAGGFARSNPNTPASSDSTIDWPYGKRAPRSGQTQHLARPVYVTVQPRRISKDGQLDHNGDATSDSIEGENTTRDRAASSRPGSSVGEIFFRPSLNIIYARELYARPADARCKRRSVINTRAK